MDILLLNVLQSWNLIANLLCLVFANKQVKYDQGFKVLPHKTAHRGVGMAHDMRKNVDLQGDRCLIYNYTVVKVKKYDIRVRELNQWYSLKVTNEICLKKKRNQKKQKDRVLYYQMMITVISQKKKEETWDPGATEII